MTIDLAAINKHHVPGTSFHWRHGYIPLDARTAALWGKKDFAASLIRSGRIHTPEPESWHALFGKHKAEESPSASKTNSAVRELPFLGAVNHAVERKQAMQAAGHREAAKNYVEAYRVLKTEQNKRDRSAGRTAQAEIGVTRALHAAIAAGVPGLAHPEQKEPHTQGDKAGPVTTLGMEHFREIAKWHAQHGANIAAIREHFGGPARTDSRGGETPKDLIALRAHLNKDPNKAPVKPRGPRPEKVNERSMLERVFHPKEGDVISLEGRGAGERLIYRESKQGFQRQTRLSENHPWATRGEIMGPKTIQHVAQGDLARIGGAPGVSGLDPNEAHAYAKSPERLARLNAGTLALGQAKFGTGTHSGFKAVSVQDAYRGSPFAASLHNAGSYYLKHDNGTVIHVNDGVPVDAEHLHRLAQDITTATEHAAPMLGSTPVNYHIDKAYGSYPGSMETVPWERANAAAYVAGGDGENIHLNPATVNDPYESSGIRDFHSMHYVHQAENSTVGTLVHELGHIHHNRTGNYTNSEGNDGKLFNDRQLEEVARQYGSHTIKPEMRVFHQSAQKVPQMKERAVRSQRNPFYGEKNNREGYAEAFAQHVFNQVKPGPQTPLSMSQRTADELHTQHSAIARKYAEHFNWPHWAQGAKEVKTA